ncbi:hypothetical protein GCM10022251_28800 [Phytohabitans flavus]|uniref:Uncharacterized protein n=1 Tax=Phytohabitans flavus TaxID=1076124 RepID=A0A6F8XP28_9ACTN|nr:hypothetical protein [Phytohabitans flavus]BCB75501.1 hypothetical protein Pflav_019110 [Phytohabitans flavus]
MADNRDQELDRFARWWDREADDDERATIKAAVAGSYQIPLALATRLSELGVMVTLPSPPESADPTLPEAYANYAISHPRQ